MIMKHLNYFLMSVIAFLFLGVNAANAAKPESDMGVLQLDHVYNLEDDNFVYGTFTPEKDGYLQVYSTSTSTTLRPFITWEGSANKTMTKADNSFVLTFLLGVEGYVQNYEIHVTKGTTYYMCGSTMKGDNAKVIMKMEDRTVKCLSCSIQDGAEVSTTGTNAVAFYFNRPVVATSAYILYGDNQQEAVTSRSSSSSFTSTITADLKSALLNLSSEGKIKEGDELTIVIKGVKEDPSNLAEGDDPVVYGDCSVKAKVGKLPAMLQSTTLDGVPVTANTKFLTYYAPGTGKLVLTFSKPLDEDCGDALLRFGDFDQKDNGGYYEEDGDGKNGDFTFTVKGNQVILDFSGKHRAVTDMVSSTESNRGADFTKISLQISSITDTDGTRAYTTTSSTKGRFNFSFTLDAPEANVQGDFTPANGASIKNEDQVEIWIADENSLSYKGVVFTYDLKENGIEPTPDEEGNVDIIKEVVVDMKDLQRVASDDPDDEGLGVYILTVPIPEEVKNMKNVTVSLYKVTCVDGKDYTDVIAAKYNVVSDGISNIVVSNDKAAKVYNLNGQLVREGNSLKGLKGVYVVNGKKVVLK